MKPKAHVSGPWRFRSDLVAGILDFYFMFFEMLKRFSQRRHVRQMEGHVTQCSWRRLSFVQGDRDIRISNGNAPFEFELLLQSQCAFEPFRTFFRVSHRQSKMADYANGKWSLHRSYISVLV